MNKKPYVWYYNKQFEVAKFVSSVFTNEEGINFVKVTEIRANGNLSTYAIEDHKIEAFFKGFRVGGLRQVEQMILRNQELLNFNQDRFVSIFE